MRSTKNSPVESFLILLMMVSVAAATAAPRPASEELRKKYPYAMLTPDYGIITEFDLASDARVYRHQPYDPTANWSASYWQCVPSKNVTTKYETWRDSDPLGAVTSIITLCSLETIVKDKEGDHLYLGRRAQPVRFCREFVKQWKRLTTSEPIVCFSGEAGGAKTKIVNGHKRVEYWWTWNKFRTKKGCHSYYGNCEP